MTAHFSFFLNFNQRQKQSGTRNQTRPPTSNDKDAEETVKKKSFYGIISTHATELSTAHGYPRIFKAKTWYSKLFWTLILVVASVAFAYQAIKLLTRYLDAPVAVEVS